MSRYGELIRKIIGIEKEIEEYWSKNDIINKVISRGEQKFYFLDGPPYVTGSIHIGTAWNKILKDFILRFKRMCGYNVWSVPGYDTHGLPIETTVEKHLKIRTKREIMDMGIDRFNELCKELVEKNIEVQTNQFKKLCVWMDWDNYYATYRNEYISRVWHVIKVAHEKGLLGQETRVFHWCPRCQTVLSDHEVAQGYEEKRSHSIYVKFKLVNSDKYLVIWTTTPWTLPSNTAIMAHPEFIYAEVVTEKGEHLIILRDRVGEILGEEKYEIVKEFRGEELEGLEYETPLIKYVEAQRKLKGGRRVVLSTEYVSADEGSGLVHTAPAHGKEDFDVAMKHDLPIISIVDDEGRYTDGAGKYAGTYVFDAEEEIINDLEKEGALLKKGYIVHSYPHCWRCHTPLILKTTRQWILKLSKLRDKMLEENRKIKWVPAWGGTERFGKWLETARDWVISRQRYWGTPLPIWRCSKCNSIRVIGSMRELIAEGYEIKDLHRPYVDQITFKCEKCGGVMKREPDVLDVWIDSGAASWASIGYPDNKDLFNKLWPVDFITEGHDQTRGWFYSLHALSIIAFGTTPLKTILMHGFALDEKGREMHKHLGNVIPPEDVIEKYGTDIFRSYVLNHPPWEDLRISYRLIEETIRVFNILFNVFGFFDTYASIDNYKYREGIIEDNYNRLLEEDKWIISVFESVLKRINDSLEEYHVHILLREIYEFITEYLSRKYIKIIRRRVWIEGESWEKEAVYHTLFYILKKVVVLLAPALPHISEYLYLNIIKKYIDEKGLESVHLENWPKSRIEFVDEKLNEIYGVVWDLINSVDSIRYSMGIKKRQPLKELLLPKKIYKELTERSLDILKQMTNTREIRSYEESNKYNYLRLRVRAKLDALGPVFKGKTGIVKEMVENLEQSEILKLMQNGKISIEVPELGKTEIVRDMVEIYEDHMDPYAFRILDDNYIFLNIKIDRELLLTGLAKDLVRRIQVMRKELELDILENIRVYVITEDKDIKDAIHKHMDYIKTETRAVEIKVTKEPPECRLKKKWEINEADVTICIN